MAQPTTAESTGGSKVIANVPALQWGKGKECTFAGALEAALAVTGHPCSYADLMGYTALAFRVRWWLGHDSQRPARDWCPSCAVGEMGEEIDAAGRATGWPLHVEVQFDPAQRAARLPQVVASLDAGRPVVAYTDQLDMGVIYGYQEGGRKLLFRDYHRGPQPDDKSVSPLGWMWLTLGEHVPAPSPEQRMRAALKMAGHNWRRERAEQGPGWWYWYGDAAYRRWLDDLAALPELTDQERARFLHVNWFAFSTMTDARRAAAGFLRAHRADLGAGAAEPLDRAAKVYEQMAEVGASAFTTRDCFLGPWTGKGVADWTAPVANRERELLGRLRGLDEAAMALLGQALGPGDGA